MRNILAACGLLLLAMLQGASAQSLNIRQTATCGVGSYNTPFLTVDPTGTLCTSAGGGGGGGSVSVSHASTTALANNLSVKAAAGSLFGFNCTAITGGAAGFCIAYNGSSTPSTGVLTGANVLDFCYFDTTARGCSLSRIPAYVTYGTGIQILLSSAASPYTYTTGTLTGAISADYQ